MIFQKFLDKFDETHEIVFLHSKEKSFLASEPELTITLNEGITYINRDEVEIDFFELLDMVKGRFFGFVNYEKTQARFSSYKNVIEVEDDFELPEFALKEPLSAAFLAQEHDEYIAKIEKMQEYMVNGDIYVANLTQRIEIASNLEPLEVFYKLTRDNPAPYSAFMHYPDLNKTIISSSVERFVEINDGIISTSPIKGTTPRGATPAEDAEQFNRLKNSIKDHQELLMITDLMRNDIARISLPGSVEVTENAKIYSFPSVHQLITTINSKLKTNKISDIFRAIFPGGSITGNPKQRAMEIIEELENTPRGIYTGTIGWFDSDLDMNLNIAIRTLEYDGEKYTLGVGGGITYDSDPESEFEEILVKAKAFFNVFNIKNTSKKFTTLLVENGEPINLAAHQKRVNIPLDKLKEGVNRISSDGTIAYREVPKPKIFKIKLADKPIISSNIYRYKIDDEKFIKKNQYKNYDDTLFYTDKSITETSIANILFEKSGKLYSPKADALRGVGLSQFDAHLIDVPLAQLLGFEKVFLVNAVRGKFPCEIYDLNDKRIM
ncbi:MAG: aminodeoxychorismate synthase component I [Lactobacillales bacterium]|jgi:para-aminobenzoate synthetase/4-amino-4-deoxychorismate lyase|nr:aminodeoxychorismate synthase component I [Lactobacillales bacterium]